jgi:hypothetical protein
MKNLTSTQLSEIIQAQKSDLPVPRLETRNFYQKPHNSVQFEIITYFLLVFEPLFGKTEVSILDSSVATVPIVKNDPLYIGWRREGDMLNLMTQLNLPAYIVDNDSQEYKKIELTFMNCPNGLKDKSYFPFALKKSMTKQEETDLCFLLAQELPLLDGDMRQTAVDLMYKAFLSKAKLSEMLGVSLIDLEAELKHYDRPSDSDY